MVDFLSKLVSFFYPRTLDKLERKIGCTLVFHDIPDRFINGIFAGSITEGWKRSGLDVEEGANHFTMGRVVNGVSTRFDRGAPEYQSWLGGYTVRWAKEKVLTVQDAFKLAISDQNGWLHFYEDPHPMATTDGWTPVDLGPITLGKYTGRLYEFGCTTHSDIGAGNASWRLWVVSLLIAVLFKVSNPSLVLKWNSFIPKFSKTQNVQKNNSYEQLDLRGFIAIFDIKPKVEVVLYANGAIVINGSEKSDTFDVLKEDLLKALKACEIREL